MTRTDFHDDPQAPRANSLVPSATVAVRDDAGRVLLIHKIDNGYWALPGGAMELGESIGDAAVREVAEETGLGVALGELVGVFTDPGHVMRYDDGEVRQEFAVCFDARVVSGRLDEDPGEVSVARWVDPAAAADLPMVATMRRQLDAALGVGRDGAPVVDDEPFAVVTAFLAALERLDLDAATALLAPDVVYQNVSLPTLHGRDATVRALRLLCRGARAFGVVTHRAAAAGPVVLTERTDSIEVGRVRAAFWVCGTFEVHGGRITLWRDYFDWAHVTAAGVRGVVRALLPRGG